MLIVGCLFGSSAGWAVPADELDRRSQFDNAPIAVEGFVIDEAGLRVVGATVELSFLPENNVTAQRRTSTDSSGYFRFAAVSRRNGQIKVIATGFRTELYYIELARPQSTAMVSLDPFVLATSASVDTRFLFAGDLAWGRSFLGLKGTVSERENFLAPLPDGLDLQPGELPPDVDGSTIAISSPEAGTEATAVHVLPYFELADYASAVLHSPVTRDLTTPHPSREFIYFTLPRSLPTLNSLGIDYVGLGNDHLYDYQAVALQDTFDALDGIHPDLPLSFLPVAHSGAGINEDAAFQPHQFDLAGTSYSMLSFNSITGNSIPPNYIADDSVPKGGAANGGDGQFLPFTTAVFTEADPLGQNRIPIVQLHMGFSNSFEPSTLMLLRGDQAIDNGAVAVIGHHPHIAHGFEFHAEKLFVHSLGNFIFDQTRIETSVGLLAQLDMSAGSLARARAVPIYSENRIPRPAVGGLVRAELTRIANSSINATVFNYNNKAWVQPTNSGTSSQTTDQSLTVTIPASGSTILDLRERGGDALVITTPTALTIKTGRDILIFGRFEDYDVDEETYDLERWTTNDVDSYACLDQPVAGAFALCLTSANAIEVRSAGPVRLPLQFAPRTIPMPLTDLSLFGYVRGDNAGNASATVEYRASRSREDGSLQTFGSETVLLPGNTFDWQVFSRDLTWPADPANFVDWEFETPRALNLFLAQAQPALGEGTVAFDDVAVVSWAEPVLVNGSVDLESPQFAHVSGPPGTYEVTLTVGSQMPTVAVGITQTSGGDFVFSDGFESL